MGKVVRVVIDPGHGGHDPGAVSRATEGLYEKDVVLAVGLELGKLLRGGRAGGVGYEVKMTRTVDEYLTLHRRSQIARIFDADLFVSLHCNSALDSAANGVECWVSTDTADVGSKRLAAKVLGELVAGFDLRDRGVKRGNFYVLRNAPCTATLVELEFISNPVGSEFLSKQTNQMMMAAAIHAGIENYVLSAMKEA